MSILNQSKTINNINNNNIIKKYKSDKYHNLKSIGNIWANEIHIKKCQSLKRILVNDFNNQNMKFNINSNYKNKNNNEKKIKRMNNGLDIINSEYYHKIGKGEDNSELKINDINLNIFAINDLKNNMNGKNEMAGNKHYNSPKANNFKKNIYIINESSNRNIKVFNSKNIKTNKNDNKKRFIDEISAMKIVEDIFVNKIKK